MSLSINLLKSLFAKQWVCLGIFKEETPRSQSLSVRSLQTIHICSLILMKSQSRKVGGRIIQMSCSCWSDFSRWKNLYFLCSGRTTLPSPECYSPFPLQIPKSSCSSLISIHMLTCSWNAYSGRVNLTSALQLQCYQKYCRNLRIFELSFLVAF